MSDIWKDFEVLCEAQNETIQLSLENDARNALTAAFASGDGADLYEAVTNAINLATEEQTWKDIVDVLYDRPSMLDPEVDGKFYGGCPKPILQKLMSGEKSLLVQFMGRLNDPRRENLRLVPEPDIRLMHMIADTAVALGYPEKLKLFAAMLTNLCADPRRSGDGRIPRSVREKLEKHGAIPKAQSGNGQQRTGSAPARPVRRPAPRPETKSQEIRLKTPAIEVVSGHNLTDQLKKVGLVGSGNGHNSTESAASVN